MKTTIELPDELMREVKIRAVEENRKLKDMVAELLRWGLSQSWSDMRRKHHRVEFPIFRGGHAAKPEEAMTPERIHDILSQQEADRALGR
jgi:hypothetical protein